MAEYVIATYIRLSIEDAKTESLSVENQRLMLNRHIEQIAVLGATVLEFVDNGHSGMNFERPAVQELLELVQLERVNCIIVKDFSRLGRNIIETGYYMERIFPLYRVRFISVSDGFDSAEHEGGTGGLEVAFKLLVHEQYSRDLSRKITSAKRARALRGEHVTKNCVFGFKKVDGRLEIDEPAAKIVRLIFEMYQDGHSRATIAARLCKDKQPTSGERKKGTSKPSCLWNTKHILSILRDEQYIGTYIAGKSRCVEIGSGKSIPVDQSEWIRIPDHHPAIVDKAVFEVVREKIGAKKKTQRKHKAKVPKPSGFSDHVYKEYAKIEKIGNHTEQQTRMENKRRTLYERLVLGEIDAEIFKTESIALNVG